MTTDSLDAALEAFNAEHRYHPLIAELNTARGQRYGRLLRQVLMYIGPAITADCERFKAETGTVTPVNLGQLMLRYGLSFKATCEFLEEARCLPTGTYEKLKRDGPKVRDVLDAARKAEAAHA